MKDAHIPEAFREDYTTMVVQFSDQPMWTYKVLRADVDKYKPGSYVLIPHVSQKKQPVPAASTKMQQTEYETRLMHFENGAPEEISNRGASYPHVKAGIVAAIHELPDIDYDAEFAYKWVIGPLDMTPYQENLDKDSQILAAVQKARNKHVRDQVRAALIGDNIDLKQLAGG